MSLSNTTRPFHTKFQIRWAVFSILEIFWYFLGPRMVLTLEKVLIRLDSQIWNVFKRKQFVNMVSKSTFPRLRHDGNPKSFQYDPCWVTSSFDFLFWRSLFSADDLKIVSLQCFVQNNVKSWLFCGSLNYEIGINSL